MQKTRYRVKAGFDWVNGAPVPESRIVELTDAEARFDLEQDRLEVEPLYAPIDPPTPEATPRSPVKSTKPQGSAS